MQHNSNRHDPEQRLDGPRALRPEEYPAALRFINSVFRPKGPYAMQNDYPLVLGENNIENMRVIVGDGTVISHTAIYFSTLTLGDLKLKVGGISSVSTDPAYRGKGLASRVMRDCIGIMRDRGCHISFLWSDRHGFYRNLGYEPAGSFYIFKPALSDLPNPSLECEIARYSSEFLPEIMAIHDREPIRTERTSREYQAYFALPGFETLLALRSGRVSAYAVMSKGDDLRGFMSEWGGNPQDLLRLVRELAALSESGDVYILAPAYANDFTNLLIKMNTPKAYMQLIMIKVVDVDRLSSVTSDHLSAKLGMDFQIAQDREGVRIRVGREEARVEPARMLSSIMFGPEPPSSFLSGFSRETLSALDKTLPIPLFIWGLDWV
jgi:predicted N-acetyltransferase YhbS